ncbi:NADPH--cytochrome P450 reductase 3 (CPR) (P450R) [Durusdinium trenchii]|uniref:NADPH--hemoprotein reductase n=1 Tax=Durusdinium trenchii TaxID=1381693 RepID=A0ABP0KVZ6_9DINO
MRKDVSDLVQLGLGLGAAAVVAGILWKLKRRSEGAQPSVTKKDGGRREVPRSAASQGPSQGLWIYFGSQMGTAEGFARELEEEASKFDIEATVVDMEDFDPDTFLEHKAVVMVMATYGEGDPTDNAVEFYKWIHEDGREEGCLKGMSFAVMGLGNRQYVNFNMVGKEVDKQLEVLGASRVYERGEGDDDQNIEEDFEQWKENGLWPALRKALGKEENQAKDEGLESAEAALQRLTLQVKMAESARGLPVDPLVQVGGADIIGKWYFQASQASVVACEELRQKPDIDGGKTTKHLEFDVKQLPGVSWRTADNLEVLPQNPDGVVEWFADRLKVKDQLEHHMTFVRTNTSKPVKKPFPAPCKVQIALSIYCDLCTFPQRNTAKRFAPLVQDAADREALFGLVQDREAYQVLVDGRLTLRDFFELFMPSADIDLSAFVQLCQRQKNRPYTIASSSKEDSTRIGICVSMVQENHKSPEAVLKELGARGITLPQESAYLQRLGETASAPRRFRGLCSEMLCLRTSKGEKLWIAARASTFRLPKRTTTPIIMLGAGTGLAPFRGFVREFMVEKGSRSKTVLFFGCTKSDEDFIYKEELDQATKADPPALKEMITAFSREQKEKIYVQHRLREKSGDVKQMIDNGGYIFVCGATSMGKQVRDELEKILGSADYLERLKTEQRYVEELW